MLPRTKEPECQSNISLVADVVHAKDECRHQCRHDDDHRAFSVVAVVDMHAGAGSRVRREQKRLKPFIYRAEFRQFSARLKLRLDSV